MNTDIFQMGVKYTLMSALFAGMFGCTTPSYQSNMLQTMKVPKSWHSMEQTSQPSSEQSQVVETTWLSLFNDPQLSQLVAQALVNNHSLQIQAKKLALAEQQLVVSDATLYPELSLRQGNSRKKLVSQESIQYQNSADVSLQLSYELDLWGKLSDQQHQTQLDYLAAKQNFLQAKQQLTADVVKSWFHLIEAEQLLALYQARAENLNNNLAMIQSSYRLGLTNALDVYLTQNNVNSELARIASQQQLVGERRRALEVLLGEYPKGFLKAKHQLPEIDQQIATGLPSQVLTQRSDVVASWYQLLALDAGVALAHKQRFPQLSLTSSIGDSSDELTQLLSGNALAWSLIGNITMPLFNGGRLAALEEQAKLRLEQQEHQYLQLVFQAFAEVENAISAQQALNKRYHYLLQAQDNAQQAEKLSFDQYIKGLVQYTTVLEAQRRSFDAQTSVIQLKNQLLQNRINLHLALGGNVETTTGNAEVSPSVSYSLISE